MCCISNNFVIGITISIWTVVQTSLHIIWVLCGHYFYVCKIKPTHYLLVMLHLTYFYSYDCGDITLDNASIFVMKKLNTNINNLDSNDTENLKVYDIVQMILDQAVLPKESRAAARAHLYLLIFIVSDAVWIVSAFLLFAGTCFQIRKCLSLIFYCPWLITTAYLIFLDVVSAVHFGLDFLQIHSFSTWLKFIGVKNYDEFSNLNNRDLSRLIPSLPTITLCLLFSRFFFVWILNVVNFFQIMNIAVLAFQDNLDKKNLDNQQHTDRRSKSRNPEDQDLNLDSSASRIRSWQLFYGATETTSTGSSSSGDKDCNSNTSTGEPRKSSTNVPVGDADHIFVRRQHSIESVGSYDERYVVSVEDAPAKKKTNLNTYYRRYADVADDIDVTSHRNIGAGSSVNSQLPWSYFPAHLEARNMTNRPSSASMKDYGRFRTIHNPLGNSQTACTEL